VVIGICYLVCPALLLTVRFILARENKKRDAEPVDDAFEEVYIEQVTADGKRVEVKVDKVRPYSYQTQRVLCSPSYSSGIPRLDGHSKSRLPLCSVEVVDVCTIGGEPSVNILVGQGSMYYAGKIGHSHNLTLSSVESRTSYRCVT